jgi:gluconolactonase
MNKIVFILFILVTVNFANAQETKPEIGSVEFISKELNSIIKKDAKVEIIADGFQFTEGPLWLEKENMLLVSDIPANTIYKWTAANGKEEYLKPAGYTDSEPRGGFMGPNGLILSNDGKLWLCQHGDRRIAQMDAPINAPATNFTTIVGMYEGKKINSPNDLFLTKNGDLYFTDPSYGFEKGPRDPKKEMPFNGVYKVDKSGKVTLLLDSIEQPNGIGILPDGKTLLVSNSDGRKKRWYAYDLAADGTLKSGRIFYDASATKEPGGCDGFKITKNGTIFAAGPGGVWIFTKAGKLIGKIKVNGVTATNIALSPDEKTIYITAVQYLLRVNMR